MGLRSRACATAPCRSVEAVPIADGLQGRGSAALRKLILCRRGSAYGTKPCRWVDRLDLAEAREAVVTRAVTG